MHRRGRRGCTVARAQAGHLATGIGEDSGSLGSSIWHSRLIMQRLAKGIAVLLLCAIAQHTVVILLQPSAHVGRTGLGSTSPPQPKHANRSQLPAIPAIQVPWVHANHTRSMDDLDAVLRLLGKRVPVSYVHFNDGEMLAITGCRSNGKRGRSAGPGDKKIHAAVDRGWQPCSRELTARLRTAIAARLPNLFVGLPCKRQYPLWSAEAERLTASNPLTTVATLFINGNYVFARQFMLRLLSGWPARVHFVTAEGTSVSRFNFSVTAEACEKHDWEHAQYHCTSTLFYFSMAMQYELNAWLGLSRTGIGRLCRLTSRGGSETTHARTRAGGHAHDSSRHASCCVRIPLPLQIFCDAAERENTSDACSDARPLCSWPLC